MGELLKKFTTRNILSISTVGVFLWSITYGVMNIERVSNALESSSLLSAFTGSFLTIIPILYYFYFRKSQTKESAP